MHSCRKESLFRARLRRPFFSSAILREKMTAREAYIALNRTGQIGPVGVRALREALGSVGYTVVSGLAEGIETCAHEAPLAARVRIFAIHASTSPPVHDSRSDC
jgi:hypothetical protein